jgi:RNA polymerase sigma-70 factor (sigma-E family)
MARDDDGYTAFVVASYPRLVRAAILMGCPRQDAEDAAQNALARCFAAWSKVRAADDPDAYVYRILVNGLFRGWRRRWRREIPHGDLPEPVVLTDPAPAVTVRESVRAALARLSPEHRRVLVLRYFADLTERQTAAVLGIAAGTVKSRASRAIAQLSQDRSLVDLSPAHHEETP